MTNDCPAPVTPSDLTGCRYRRVLTRAAGQGRVSPELSADAQVERLVGHARGRLRRAAVCAALPTSPRFGERLVPTRVDIDAADAVGASDATAEERTLEALAAGTRLITGARLADGALSCEIDLLVRTDPGLGPTPEMTYMPVTVTGHTVTSTAKKAKKSPGVRLVDVAALGLATPVVPSDPSVRHRSTPVDSQKVAVAHVLLEAAGVASGDVGFIGGGLTSCLVIPAERVVPGLVRALEAPVPDAPLRVRECGTCEFHNQCRARLLARGDISLMLPGEKGEPWRLRGIDTLPALAVGGGGVDGETAALATAWMAGVGYLRRPLRRWITTADLWCGHRFRMPDAGDDGVPMAAELADAVEIDVDMEAHPNRGTFLWGTFDGEAYRSFTDFSADGDDGRHVAAFWTWLTARRSAAADEGRVCRVYCYAKQGENHWLRYYAERFGGTVYGDVTMPTPAEVDAFLGSEQWVDVFALVKQALAANASLGLKATAPLAGFTFSQDDVDGRVTVDLFEVAVGGAASSVSSAAAAAQRRLERYNADDCYATAAVRRWLRLGAPGIPALSDPLDRV